MLNFTRENQGIFANCWRNIDKTLFSIVFVLFFLGLFFSFSSTSIMVAEKLNIQSYYFFLKHLLFVFIAFFFIFYISLQSKELIKDLFPFIFFVTFFLLLLVPFFGSETKGSQRWLDFPFVPRFQPIEIMKPFFVLIIAKIMASNFDQNIYKKYLFTLIILSSVLILLIIQPDLGQSILFTEDIKRLFKFEYWSQKKYCSGFLCHILLTSLIVSS